MQNKDMPITPIYDRDGTISLFQKDQVSADGLAIGLTKREMFAMHAMQAFINVHWSNTGSFSSGSELLKCLSESAVEHADALLEELSK